MKNSYVVVNDRLSAFIDGKMYHASVTTAAGKDAHAALLVGDYVQALDFLDIDRLLNNISGGLLVLSGNNVMYDGTPIISDIVTFLKTSGNRYSIEVKRNFMSKLVHVSDKVAADLLCALRDELVCLNQTGDILMFKKVTVNKVTKDSLVEGDFVDVYTETIRNNVGDVVEMDRSSVVVSDYTGGAGLYTASAGYAATYGNYGDPVVVTAISPGDVVNVIDLGVNIKVRCCKYKVVGELGERELHPTSLEEFINYG